MYEGKRLFDGSHQIRNMNNIMINRRAFIELLNYFIYFLLLNGMKAVSDFRGGAGMDGKPYYFGPFLSFYR